ncbi:hypothetical protein SLA2020_067600 [Shorea laevis]
MRLSQVDWLYTLYLERCRLKKRIGKKGRSPSSTEAQVTSLSFAITLCRTSGLLAPFFYFSLSNLRSPSSRRHLRPSLPPFFEISLHRLQPSAQNI